MKKEILPLTSLRFVTAFYVFLFHIQIRWPLAVNTPFSHFLNKGSCGMSMFFILSGFVLGYRFHQGITHYNTYLIERFTRIYPAYFLAALITIPWLIVAFSSIEHHALFGYSFVIFINIFMLQAWIPRFFDYWNDGGSWSLSVEMFFYALFPFFINQFKNIKNNQLYLILIVAYVINLLPGLSMIIFNNDTDVRMFYSVPIFRISEFIMGIICGLLFVRGYTISKPTLSATFSLISLYIVLAFSPEIALSMGYNGIVVPLLALLLFSMASLSQGWLYRLMTLQAFVYLGRISYSFYSFQAFILLILISRHDTIIQKYSLLKHNYLLCLTAFVALVIMSSLSYYFIETKFRQYLTTKFTKKIMTISPNLQPSF